MNKATIRKIGMFFLSLALLAMALALPYPVMAGSGTQNSPITPQDLVNQGWVCLYIANPGVDYQYAFCMPHNYDGLGPQAVTNKTFLVSDANFSNPIYLGNSLYLRSDIYAGQPCPTNSSPLFMEVLGGMYYNCRHFEQTYP